MKKYIKHIDDEKFHSENGKDYYFRIVKNITDKVYCFKKYEINSLNVVRPGEYNIKYTQKLILVNEDGFIEKQTYSVYLVNLYHEKFITENEMVYENGFSVGRALITEKVREFF
jgi:hypothetical protein